MMSLLFSLSHSRGSKKFTEVAVCNVLIILFISLSWQYEIYGGSCLRCTDCSLYLTLVAVKSLRR